MSEIDYPFSFTPDTTGNANQVDSNFNTISSIVNGQLDGNNFKSDAGITLGQLSLNPGGRAFNRSTTGMFTWAAGLTTDMYPRAAMTTDAGIQFGAGGGSPPDSELVHSASNTLQINDTTGGPGNLDLNGGMLLNASLGFTTLTIPGDFTTGSLGTGGQLTLFGSTSGNAVIKVNPAAGTTTFTLPVGNGAANEVLMTDGAGNTSWQQSFGRRFSAAITLAANQQQTVSNPLGAIPAMIWFAGIATTGTFVAIGSTIYLYPSGDLTDTLNVNDCILVVARSGGALIQVDTGPQVSYGGTPIPFADFNWTMFVVG